MGFERSDEIHVPAEEFKTNDEGKKYLTEEGGVFYGGDYLPKPPTEIRTDLPPAPPEDLNNPVL